MATSIGSRRKLRWKDIVDFLAVAGPIICLIDCVVLPVASALLPFIGMTEFGHGISDQQLFFLVLGICGLLIIPGYLKHRNRRVLCMFLSAITLMFFVNFEVVHVDETAHAVLSLFAAFLLIKANRDNKKLLSCSCSMHHHAAHAETPMATVASASGFNQVIEVESVHAHHHDHSSKPCLHEVVVALEMQEQGLDPCHFEPRNNLNFEPIVITQEAPPVAASAPAASVCF